MAIFGNLTTLPFADILSLLETRSGQLKVQILNPVSQIELFVRHKFLQAVEFNGLRLDRYIAKQKLQELFSLDQGTFEFIEDYSEVTDAYQWHIERLQLGVASLESTEELSMMLAPPEVRFVASRLSALYLEKKLHDFWRLSRPFLTNGTSAHELVVHLGLPLTEIQLMLYRFRAAKQIKPFRVYQETSVLGVQKTKLNRIKLVISGPVGAGKTTFIRGISEIATLDTDVVASENIGKKQTTIALDLGRITLDKTVVHLWGTPGQERFDFLWDELSRGAQGLLLLISSVRPDQFHKARSILEFITSRYPLVFRLGITHTDLPNGWSPVEIADYFQLSVNQFDTVNPNNPTSSQQSIVKIVNTINSMS